MLTPPFEKEGEFNIADSKGILLKIIDYGDDGDANACDHVLSCLNFVAASAAVGNPEAKKALGN